MKFFLFAAVAIVGAILLSQAQKLKSNLEVLHNGERSTDISWDGIGQPTV